MKETFKEIISAETPTLVNFSAAWCGPFNTMEPALKEAARATKGKARIIKIDIDKNPTVAAHYKVQSVPTLIQFKNGQTVWRSSGVMPAHALSSIIYRHFN